jgi:hypothetical protein
MSWEEAISSVFAVELAAAVIDGITLNWSSLPGTR